MRFVGRSLIIAVAIVLISFVPTIQAADRSIPSIDSLPVISPDALEQQGYIFYNDISQVTNKEGTGNGGLRMLVGEKVGPRKSGQILVGSKFAYL